MTTPAPSRHLSTPWGDLTATCDHPHHVTFDAGTTGTGPLRVDGFDYVARLTVHRDSPGDLDHRARLSLTGDWYTLSADAWLALSQPNGVAAITRHQQTFIDGVLPELAAWLVSGPARGLVTEGTVHWRERCVGWAASTETDLNRALGRVRKIRDAIAAGHIPTAADERYMRYARVHPR